MIERDPVKIKAWLDAEFPISAHLEPEDLCNCPVCLKKHQTVLDANAWLARNGAK